MIANRLAMETLDQSGEGGSSRHVPSGVIWVSGMMERVDGVVKASETAETPDSRTGRETDGGSMRERAEASELEVSAQ